MLFGFLFSTFMFDGWLRCCTKVLWGWLHWLRFRYFEWYLLLFLVCIGQVIDKSNKFSKTAHLGCNIIISYDLVPKLKHELIGKIWKCLAFTLNMCHIKLYFPVYFVEISGKASLVWNNQWILYIFSRNDSFSYFLL